MRDSVIILNGMLVFLIELVLISLGLYSFYSFSLFSFIPFNSLHGTSLSGISFLLMKASDNSGYLCCIWMCLLLHRNVVWY